MRNLPTTVVSGRVSKATKTKLQQLGKNGNVSDAVYYFISQKSNPVTSLEIDLFFAKENLTEKKLDLIEAEKAVADIEEKLDIAKAKTGNYDDELKLKKLAKDFIKKYEEDKLEMFEGKDIHEAMNISHKGLSHQAMDLGYTFNDIHNEILMQYNQKKM
jgi:hypothetical protein